MQNAVMTFGEKTSMGLMTTGLGLLVVFSALALIIVVTMILSKIVMEKPNKRQSGGKSPDVTAATPAPIKIENTPKEDANLIAVLSAVVAAYIGSDSEGKLVVRSYRKLSGENQWSAAGRSSQLNCKF